MIIEIGAVIAGRRKSRGMTRKELAEKSNVSVKTLRKIENNECDPRLKTLERIAKALGCRLEEIAMQAEQIEKIKEIRYLMMGAVSEEDALKCGYTKKEYAKGRKVFQNALNELDDFLEKLDSQRKTRQS